MQILFLKSSLLLHYKSSRFSKWVSYVIIWWSISIQCRSLSSATLEPVPMQTGASTQHHCAMLSWKPGISHPKDRGTACLFWEKWDLNFKDLLELIENYQVNWIVDSRFITFFFFLRKFRIHKVCGLLNKQIQNTTKCLSFGCQQAVCIVSSKNLHIFYFSVELHC